MDEKTHAFLALFTPEGIRALEAAEALFPREKEFLQDFQLLSKRFPREVARMGLSIAILRQEAKRKFPQAEKMFFTRTALEQATAWEIATYRAKRYSKFSRVYDLGCSIGGDTLALAQVAQVVGFDLDELRLHMARSNAVALGCGEQASFVQADITSLLPFKMDEHIGMFFDPERRANHHRVYSVSEYTPSLAVVNSWLGRVSGLGVKISPGVDLVELADFNAEVEFISLNGELKEAVLWFGSLKSTSRRATILPGGYTLTVDHQDKLLLSEPRAYLYEPDPAILRAGFVEMLGTRLDAFQLDPQIAYLTGDHLHESPFARVWPVEDWMPFQLKRLRAYLRERGIGKVTVKKRGSPLQPEELIRDLRLDGNEEKTLFLTQLQDRPIVVICGDEIKNVV